MGSKHGTFISLCYGLCHLDHGPTLGERFVDGVPSDFGVSNQLFRINERFGACISYDDI